MLLIFTEFDLATIIANTFLPIVCPFLNIRGMMNSKINTAISTPTTIDINVKLITKLYSFINYSSC